MRRTLGISAVQGLHLATLLTEARRFHAACREPERVQNQLLRSVLTSNANTTFGAAHGFSRISNVQQFQRQVPIREYADFSPWLEPLLQGQPRQLTYEPPLAVEPTSGSSAARKLIPYTNGLLNDFRRATSPWLFDLLRHHPKLWGRSAYWSVSAAARAAEQTVGGIPIGLPDDTAYFGRLQRWAIQQTLAVSPTVGQISDQESWQWETARQLLMAKELGFVSVWHPSFFTLQVEYIQRNWDKLLLALPHSRRKELTPDNQTPLSPRQVWPHLSLISCWTEGAASLFTPPLRRLCPDVTIQGKGLLATEGVVSIPLTGQPAPVCAVTSHFLEFADLEQPSQLPLTAARLRHGAQYQPILTTSGGLYRYALGDVVECVGHYRNAPLLVFRGRTDRRSDLTGEKLDGCFVQQALEQACVQQPLEFALLAPEATNPPHYVLYAQGSNLTSDHVSQLELRLDQALMESYHYGLSRKHGQLAPVRVAVVQRGWDVYQTQRMTEGMRQGDIKPTCLTPETYWGRIFKTGRDVSGVHA